MTSKRSEKVAEAIHEIVSGLLVKGLKDPRIGFVTITGVSMTDDLHQARVFFSVIGSDTAKKESEQGLNSAKGFVRKEVAKNLRMRFAPDILFVYDESIEQGNRIESILKEISRTEKVDDN